MIDVLLPFLILLGVLIFIHELGHFLAALWFGVKVEKFSLGFGPALLRKRVGETEYVIAALPLGGFVKMLGELPGEELPEAERERAFNYKPPFQRIAIALAGPAMNFVLPVFLIAAVLMVGLPTPTSRVGGVVPGSAAALAGLAPGDRIVEIDGQEIWQWSELTAALRGSDVPEVQLVVERGDARQDVIVTRERLEAGGLGPLGIEQAAPAPLVAVPDPNSPAAQAGLETGDSVTQVDGVPVGDLYALRSLLEQATGRVELEVQRAAGGPAETVRVSLTPANQQLEALGLYPVNFQIRGVTPATPARRAGFEQGDIFLAVDGETIRSSSQLVDYIRASAGRTLTFDIWRDGEVLEKKVAPIQAAVPGQDGIETHYTIGINLGAPVVGGEFRDLVVRNPFRALWMGVDQTVDMTGAILSGIYEMLRGSIGVKQLAGPIGIGEIAADTFRASWLQFLSFMGLISVNLAILNLLPVPVLDGGTILLTSLEWIKGGPLPNRARDFAQTVGLSFILLLMGFAFWNDISRNWEGIVGFFRGLV